MLSALVLSLALAGGYAPAPVMMASGPHPRVFLTPNEAVRVRERSTRLGWAREIRERILDEAGDLLAEPLDVPRDGGQWIHWYTCKKDGGPLKPKSPERHVCSICGAVYTGWPYDQVYVTFRHQHWLSAVDVLGLAYLLDPKPAFAARVREILLEYASFYRDLPLHNIHNRKGSAKARLFAQTLDEAVMLCRIVRGYDFVYEAPCFSTSDHGTIRTQLLMPMVKTIRANNRGMSNWQSWHNAAIGCTGFLLGDHELTDHAVNGRSGFLFQMSRSVASTGMWYEQAPIYHFYALDAHIQLIEAAGRSGIPLADMPIVKKLFDAPIRQLYPDGTFPALQASERTSIRDQRRLYEVGYCRFGDARYLSFLEPRDSVEALLWGMDDLPPPPADLPRLISSNAPAEGIAVLRNPARGLALFLDYGHGMSGHVQPAKLGITLYAFGEERLVDPGRFPYGNPLHKSWYRQTLAHNTVVVAEHSQWVTCGKLAGFAARDGWSVARARCENAYRGVVLDRTVAMNDNLVVDVFRCDANRTTTFDLPLHFRGELANLPQAEPVAPLARHGGYQHLRELERFKEPLRQFDVLAPHGRRIHIRVLDLSTSYRALGFGDSPSEVVPLILRRQKGTDAVFVTAYEMLEPGEEPCDLFAAVGRDVTVTWSDAALFVGEKTRFSKGGCNYYVGEGGAMRLNRGDAG
jgi:oligo-alginate lyase